MGDTYDEEWLKQQLLTMVEGHLILGEGAIDIINYDFKASEIYNSLPKEIQEICMPFDLGGEYIINKDWAMRLSERLNEKD